MNYTSVVLGGTFDRLHTGHRSLFAKAFSVGKHVTIGLTTEEYMNNVKYQMSNVKCQNYNSKRIKKIASHQVRKHILEGWLNSQGWNGRYTIIPLNDSYGPTLLRPSADGLRTGKRSDFDAIVVSSETRPTADKINAIRQKNGLHPLAVIEMPMIPAQDLKYISSTRIRNGEIDSNGRLVLPDNLRPEFRKPIGTILSVKNLRDVLIKDRRNAVITVGDMTTEKVLMFGVKPHLAIIDFQMKRKPFLWEREVFHTLTDASRVREIQSGPGYISREAIQAIGDWAAAVQKPTLNGISTVFIIDGEEDLLVLPAIIEAPLHSILYYGQPKNGLVRVEVTKKKKQQAQGLIHKFINTI